MSFLISVWQLAWQRSIANRRLISTILAGVIITVAILSSVPMYSNAIDEFGLKHVLRNRSIELLDINVYAPKYDIDYDEFTSSTEFLSDAVPPALREIIRQEETWVFTPVVNAYYTDRPTPFGQYQPKGFFTLYSNLEQHINLIEGAMAQPLSDITVEEMKEPDFVIEGMLGSETAALMELVVGDRFILRDTTGEEITIELSGIIDPVNPEEEFWFLNTLAFTYPTEVYNEQTGSMEQVGPTAPVFIPEETFFNIVPILFPFTKASYNWYYFLDIEKIHLDNAGRVRTAIKEFDTTLIQWLSRSLMITTLDSIIRAYQAKLVYSQIPFFLIIFQVTALILYYLTVVSGMLIEREKEEIAVLRSRGAGTMHILAIYFAEGVMISIAGGAVGLLAGVFLFSLLGRSGAFQALTGGEMLPVRITGTVLTLTVSAMILCLLTLVIPAFFASRQGVVHQKQTAARPPSNPLWKRFYLDIVLVVLGVVLYWEAKGRGSFVTSNIFGGTDMDPLLLMTPILLLIAIAIVFLRVFPLLIRLAGRLTRYFNNAWLALGLWYMERDPGRYSRLILLLVAVATVGMFSSTFIGTVERSHEERAYYEAGADARLEYLKEKQMTKGNLEIRYLDVEGIENVGVAYRMPALYSSSFSGVDIELLAVDPEKMKEIAWFRDDLDDKSLEELMDIVAADSVKQDGMTIPEDAETAGVWVYSPKGNLVTDIYARFRDGKGRYVSIRMGTTDPEEEGWQYMETIFYGEGTLQSLVQPLRLSCLYVRTNPQATDEKFSQSVYFDNLQINGAAYQNPLVIEDFEDVSEWYVSRDLNEGTKTGELFLLGSIRVDKGTVHDGAGSGEFKWDTRNFDFLGIYHSPDLSPLTAIASQSFIDSAKVKENEAAVLRVATRDVSVNISEAVAYFPTLNPEEKGFIIVNLDRLLDVRNRQLDTPTTYPNEVWMTLADDKELRDNAISTIDHGYIGADNLYDTDAMQSETGTDPMVGAAWGGVLMIVFICVVFVSSLGFLVYSYLSAQRKKVDFAVLRTVGFSLRQIIGLVCFEQCVVIVVGMGLGTITGINLNNVVMPFLQITEQGETILPPFVLTTDWGTIGITYGIILIAFAITISLVIRYFSRAAISETLRIGD